MVSLDKDWNSEVPPHNSYNCGSLMVLLEGYFIECFFFFFVSDGCALFFFTNRIFSFVSWKWNQCSLSPSCCPAYAPVILQGTRIFPIFYPSTPSRENTELSCKSKYRILQVRKTIYAHKVCKTWWWQWHWPRPWLWQHKNNTRTLVVMKVMVTLIFTFFCLFFLFP